MEKKVRLFLVLCMTLLCAGFCFAEDPALGFWLSVDEKTGKTTAGWEIYQEKNGLLYGKMLSVAEFPQDQIALLCKESYRGFPASGKVNQMRVVGTPWIFGLRQEKEGQWSGGNIINPEDGNMYKCKITFHKANGAKYKTDTLEMRGEIGLGIGRSQFWRKATRAEAAALR
ncbi:MAG: DUF2147 domain-containing protein [Treponema sp.]|jgi:uncharacterized protein (DUF2147 family)|nr:DUF2147 domain-containing protein [Treponema sp.]